MPVVSGNASGEGPLRATEKLWHHLTCLDVAIQTTHSFSFPPLSSESKKSNSEVKLAGQTALTFLFGILRVNYSSPSVGSNPKVQERNLNYLEIQDQYLSTLDNMLIICTPQNSIPPTAIG